MPVAALPEPSRTTLKGAPLEQVIWQVRHEASVTPRDVKSVLQVRGLLADSYPVIEEADITEVSIGIVGDSSGVNQRNKIGWRLRTNDNLWAAVLMDNFVAIESQGYTTWTEFFRRAKDLISAVEKTFSPALMQRVGLRYVDRLVRPDTSSPAHWNNLLNPAVLGLAVDSAIGADVVVTQTMTQMKFDDHFAILRTSCAPDSQAVAGYSMLLDTDCFDARARAFSVADIEDTTSKLHDLGLKLFQRSLTPDYLKELADGALDGD